MDALLKQAEELAGRPVEVESTTDGKYVVLYMAFEKSPPPKSDTEEGALVAFIEMMKKRKSTETEIPV